MESFAFFNPYLNRDSKRESRREATNKGFLQIVPRGVMYDGTDGLIKNTSHLEPRMFFGEREYLLKRDMRWPGLDVERREPVVVSGDRSPLCFHTYDQVETLSLADSTEGIFPGYRHHIVPAGNVLRMFGVASDGRSVCVNVFGQKTYFYCEGPDAGHLRDIAYGAAGDVSGPHTPFTVTVDPVQRISIYGYGTKCVPDLYRLSFNNWSMAKKIGRLLFERGYRVYEIGVDPLTRFFIDRKVPSFGWCRLRRFHRRAQRGFANVDLEVDCETSDVIGIPEDISWPIYRCLAFDLECLSASGGFPVADNVDDIVIQISCVCFRTGGASDASHVDRRYLFTVGPCAPIDNVSVYEFPSEYEMLLGFFIFFQCYGAEIVSGYNINAFDIRYLLTRMEKIYHVGVGCFTKLSSGGRFYWYVPAEHRQKTFGSASHTKVFATGIVVIDMYPVCAVKATAQNYKLNTMSEVYLGKQKEDLSYKEIPKQFALNDEGRARVGRYCVQDAVLVRELFDRIGYHFEAAAVSRLARIPLRRVIFEGQQARIYTCLLEECAVREMIMPNLPVKRQGWSGCVGVRGVAVDGEGEEEEEEGGCKVGYQGATVFEPDVGYYHMPVLVFDFASLYPSIIRAHNLCYSTLVCDEESLSDEDVFVVDLGEGVVHRFVREHVRRSILAELLTRWLTERKLVKEKMRECGDESERVLLDKHQMALKVTCNAFYGFTGVAHGMLPCLAIAASITKIGRDMLTSTTEYIHRYFADARFWSEHLGVEENAFSSGLSVRVIYGDTDSMFVCVSGVRSDVLLGCAERMALHISERLFRDPIRLEFEKMFVALMLICKKRYIGRVYGSSKLVMKGVDLVRKTACVFVKNVVREILDLVFNDDEVSSASMRLSRMTTEELKRDGVPDGFACVIRRLCRARDSLFLNRVDVSELVLSSVLSQHVSQYKQKNLPHLAVVRRLAARQEELPTVGDRVEYVLTFPSGCHKGAANYELAEDPRYVREHRLTVHAERYFEQVIKAVTNALLPIFPKDLPKREKFFHYVLPLRVYLEAPFTGMCVAAERTNSETVGE
uniref:DNA polymerase n=1 Tax=Lemniscomys rat herpesvirus TaxID=3141920 RepID=A0AAU7E175_9VIRU